MTAPVLPAGAFAGWDLHPLESAAFARRTPIAEVWSPRQNHRKGDAATVSKDPLAAVVDESLTVDDLALQALRDFRREEKLALLPGVDTSDERARLTRKLNDLADVLLRDVERNSSKRWVMSQFQRALEGMGQEDTEAREHFGLELEHVMDILEIESSDGLLTHYLGGI